MRTNKKQKEKIQNIFSQKAIEIEPSKELFNKIRKDIYEQECNKTMKNKLFGLIRGKRLVTIAACCVVLGSITVIGATMGKSWISHSQAKYMTFPSEERIQKDVGFVPKYTDTLPGGFEYSNGGFGESQLEDEGNILTHTKDVILSYTREGQRSPLNLSITQVGKEFLNDTESQLVGEYKEIELYYYEKEYKFVPEDYELTEEDKKANEMGVLEISYGASEVSNEIVQGLSWYEDGLQYMVMGNDYNFTVEEMTEMAKVIIDQG